MKYLINSNKLYSKISLRKIIPSLLDCGIAPEDILVILGGCENESNGFTDCGLFQCFNTKINAIDQTSFYIINKYNDLFEDNYYFYLHDTCYVGYEFKKVIEQIIKNNKSETIKCFNGKSSNIGIYSKKSLLEFFKKHTLYTDYENILCDISDPNNYEKLMKKKQISYELEDYIFKNTVNAFMCKNKQKLGKCDFYNTGNKRVLFCFQGIGLYKTNANTSDLVDNKPTFLGCKI
jgi:hypothetical protein